MAISKINRSLLPKKLKAMNGETVIWQTDKIFPQHFYPLTIKEYCEAVKGAVKAGISQMPILSVSSKDYPYCDFNCIDCLACPSREWATGGGIKQPIIPIATYKKILDEISKYSKERGCESVRFELCGEGNPDLYKDRIEMIEYAVQKCNMGIVYVSTGSRVSEELADCLVANAACIRISFPGINPTAYKYYSGQTAGNSFTYEDAMCLLEKLCNKRREKGREGDLLIGTRTCIRPLNDGNYKDFLSRIGQYGVNAFQAVQVLTPEFGKHQHDEISEQAINELLELKGLYRKYGLMSYQIPNVLTKTYNDRTLRVSEKPQRCWSSLVSPLLYGTNLISCALWDRITNPQYHYGIMEGEPGELREMMNGANADFIKENCPLNCTDCCSHNDNEFLESLYGVLRRQDNVDNVKFYLE